MSIRKCLLHLREQHVKIVFSMKKNLLKSGIALFVFAFSLSFCLPFAKAEDNKNDRLFGELEKIKNEQIFYSQNLENLQGQSMGLMLSIDETKELLSKTVSEMQESESSLREMQKSLKTKRETRDKLMKRAYIKGSLYNILSFLFSDDAISGAFGDTLKIAKISGSTIEQIKSLNEEEQKVADEIEAIILKRKSLQDQVDLLENQLAYIGGVIETNSDLYGSLEQNRQSVEGQLLDAGVKIDIKNSRDFINWNSVDFSKQNEVAFYGAGTAHGIGMSQYGAKAFALKGKSYKDILSYYYRGTGAKKVDTSKTIVRVKVSANSSGGNIIIRDGTANLIEENEPVKVLANGESVFSKPGIRLVPNEESTRFEIDYKEDQFNLYRGVIEIQSGPNNSIVTVNHIYMEDYLRSVIPGEMSASWPQEALKSQAVAARSYAFKSLNPKASFDICDSAACQVYLGARHEFATTDKAVSSTKGEMVFYGNEVITAYYFSSSGGWTENNENIWGGTPRPYLRGVPSPDETSPYNSWQTPAISKQSLQNVLNRNPKTSIGELQRIDIIKRGVSGRVMAIKISGSEGDKTVTGYTFKTIVNMALSGGQIHEILFGIR